ncbi:unnamed protein product, partial [marine sediment metagenome]
VAGGGYHSLALRPDGSVVGWGLNGNGQTAAPGGSNFTTIAAGMYHSLAIREDGALAGWGLNTSGQIDVPLGNDFVAIAGGGTHSLAIREDGSIVGWGAGLDPYGLISGIPAGNDFVAIAAGQSHDMALRADGSVVGWGNNDYGKTDAPPVPNFGVVAVGLFHTFALEQVDTPAPSSLVGLLSMGAVALLAQAWRRRRIG